MRVGIEKRHDSSDDTYEKAKLDHIRRLIEKEEMKMGPK